jgi:hypothetical protein
MSKDSDKIKHSRRLHQDEVHIQRQVDISRQAGMPVKEPHRMSKHHAMDCGQPGCVLCGNPRKLWGELTLQEQRMFQDIDTLRDRHSNGLKPDDE